MSGSTEPESLPAAPGAIGFLRNPGRTPWCSSIGLASLEHAIPLNVDTVMNVGSVAKQVTSRLILTAVREGRLRLDAAIADLLPRSGVHDVTVLDLVRHGGGIRDAESMLSLAALRDLDHYTSNDLLALAFRQERRAAAVGTFLYSNTGYLLLAEILRTTYGQPLQHIAAERIFKPIGMNSAVFRSDPRTVILNAAGSYRRGADGAWTSELRPVALDGPGSLWCSVGDLDRWLTYVRSEWSARSEPLPYATNVPYVPSDRAPLLYGPGLYTDADQQDPSVFHFGHEHGFSAAVHLTRSGKQLICMSNRADLNAAHLARQLLTQPDLPQRSMKDLVKNALTRRTDAASSAHDTPSRSATSDDFTDGIHLEYVSDDVPGVLRLSRAGRVLRLQRRGSVDHLTETDAPNSVYRGPGYTIHSLHLSEEPLPASFVLDLDRAPGIQYRRRL